jgi:hypothetical protein
MHHGVLLQPLVALVPDYQIPVSHLGPMIRPRSPTASFRWLWWNAVQIDFDSITTFIEIAKSPRRAGKKPTISFFKILHFSDAVQLELNPWWWCGAKRFQVTSNPENSIQAAARRGRRRLLGFLESHRSIYGTFVP